MRERERDLEGETKERDAIFRDKAKGRETIIERQSKENERKNTNR